MDVTHFKLVATDPRPRYRMKQMRFVPHQGCAASIQPVRDKANIDRFAEHLANGCTVTKAARLLGFSGTYGNAMLQRIRKWLGLQVV